MIPPSDDSSEELSAVKRRRGSALRAVDLGLTCLALALAGTRVCAGGLDRTGTQWAPFLEWSLRSPTFQGNPFDLVATATFVHEGGKETRTTEMFFDGDGVWKFRFTGTRVGRWAFTTRSADPDLDGRSGAVTIRPNADPRIRGFLSHVGNRFAIQGGTDGKLRGYRFSVYMNRAEFPGALHTFADLSRVDAYFADAQKHGFETLFFMVMNNWFKLGAMRHTEHKSVDPDRKTFELLERIITRVHAKGGRVHLWAWGDESRRWTPRGVGGINGEADRRLQRYIAARLGPLPGWTLGYGFDLHEWVRREQIDAWAKRVDQKCGWRHLLCARGQNPPSVGVNSYDGFGRRVPLTTTGGGPRDYAEIVKHLDSDRTRPHLYEERHTYRRKGFRLDMDGTRRLLWWQAMAGGMGGFYGFYPEGSRAYRGHPYPKPEQLRTVARFWRDRFRLAMVRANELSRDRDTRALRQGNRLFVFYREDARAIHMDLSPAAGSLAAVAVDTKKEYRELPLGKLPLRPQVWTAPYPSDWAIAVAAFPRR